MRVALCRLRLAMTKQGTDDRQRHAASCSNTGEAVTQVMKPHIIQTSRLANAPPWLLQVDQMRTGLLATNHIRVVFKPWDGGEHLKRWGVEIDAFLSRFAVWKAQLLPIKINVLPLKCQYLAQASACECQKPNSSRSRLRSLYFSTWRQGFEPSGCSPFFSHQFKKMERTASVRLA